MPIAELSDARRITRDFKVLLGEPMKNRSYPKEVDYFVLDGAPEDVRNLYGETPRALRIMLYMEWDARDSEGRELVFNLNNRAYGATKGLKCWGHGRSFEHPDYATTSDESWATRIAEATEQEPQPIPSRSGVARYRVRCLGRDCPKYLHLTDQPDPADPSKTKQQLAPDHDRDASCKAVGILRAVLLHPQRDPASPDYCKPLGVMELATGSVNSIVDLQSAFDQTVKTYAGRTAGVPLTLVRRPITTFRPFRQIHFTCALDLTGRAFDEMQRFAAVPLSEIFRTDEQRATAKRLAASPLGLTVESVAGLLPDTLLPADLRESRLAAPKSQSDVESPDAATGGSASRSQPSGVSEPGPLLVRAELDELKLAAGGLEDPSRPWSQTSNPWRQDSLDRLRRTIAAMNDETGTSVGKFAELRQEHVEWILARLRSLPPLGENE